VLKCLERLAPVADQNLRVLAGEVEAGTVGRLFYFNRRIIPIAVVNRFRKSTIG